MSKMHALLLSVLVALPVYAKKEQNVHVVKDAAAIVVAVQEDKPKAEPKKNKGFVIESSTAKLKISGKFQTEANMLINGSALNSEKVGSFDGSNDVVSKVRTTFDGKLGIDFVNDLTIGLGLRARFDAGGNTLVKTAKQTIKIAGVATDFSALNIDKHLFWMREAFVSVPFGAASTPAYVKFGMFPYELGRGISLGSAYKSNGFVGFDPAYSIDQYAPGLLLHVDLPFLNNLMGFDAYLSLLENKSDSFKSNTEKIYANELLQGGDSQTVRGPSSQSWLTAAALHIKPIDKEDTKISIDPYVMYRLSPNQSLEFPSDSESSLATIGTSMDFEVGNFTWGMETAFNKGHQDIRAWDRNYTVLGTDATGSVVAQYTYVASVQDATVDGENPFNKNLVTANSTNAVIVNATKNVSQNGVQLTTEDPVMWNAFDRFRPAQTKQYGGWFFITDATYKTPCKQFKFATEAGFVSGDLDALEDVSTKSNDYLMSQTYNGFVPVHSVYSGRHLSHMVMLDVGIPRFAKFDYGQNDDTANTSDAMGGETFSTTMTNVAFVGFGVDYAPNFFKENKVTFKPSVIQYWSPVSPNTASGKMASSNLGVAVGLGAVAKIREYIDLEGYFGVFVPGQQYTDMKGTRTDGGKCVSGDSNAYYARLAVACKF